MATAGSTGLMQAVHARAQSRTVQLLRGLSLLLALCARLADAGPCGDTGVALQVLGSGGPVADDERAASGYLLWLDGRARVLVDAGGGVFLRFAQSGARIEDLDLLALTHLHTDHAADVPALLMGGYFAPRHRALPVSGPTGNDRMPATGAFLDALFAPGRGAFRYLSGFLDGSDGLFALQPIEVDATRRDPAPVFDNSRIMVTAVGVHHGPIPSLGYLFELGGRRIAISGDQNLADDAFARLAAGTDLMVMPMAIPAGAGKVARSLHATPGRIGTAARQAAPAQLVVSHLMRRSLDDLDGNLARIRERYPGRLTVAADLACVAADGSAAAGDPATPRTGTVRPGTDTGR